ncbi:MAG: ABC transporter substrate-binding protein, partial [Methanosarcinales archaeon]|nr:ABC transporter substrate-binding protein [Methanosarcinales archaeon]
IFGVNTGNRDKAETVVSDMRSRIQAVEYRAAGHPEPRVLLMLDPAWGFWSGGTDTFMDCMIDIAGGRNWRTDTGWVNVGIEYLLADPPCIFIAVGPYCMDAVGTQFPNSRVYNLTCSSMTQRPGPRIIYPIEEMNRYIHP